MGGTVQAICNLHFERDRLPTNLFRAHASTLMEDLHTLDECNDGIADALVSSDAGNAAMTVEMFVAASDPFEASELALGIIRTALHAAGAYTGGWPISHLANETRDASELIDALTAHVRICGTGCDTKSRSYSGFQRPVEAHCVDKSQVETTLALVIYPPRAGVAGSRHAEGTGMEDHSVVDLRLRYPQPGSKRAACTLLGGNH